MNIYARLAQALSPVGLPVFRRLWRPSKEYPTLPARYIILLQLNHRPELGGDDRDTVFTHYLRVDVYGDRAMDAEVEAARAALNAAGFSVGEDTDLTDIPAQDYHTSISVRYYDFGGG